MPAARFSSPKEALDSILRDPSAPKSLEDHEIEDDSKPLESAVIRVAGVGDVRIREVSEYHFWYVLAPMRERFLNHYANLLAETRNLNAQQILDKIRTFLNDLSAIKPEELVARVEAMTRTFSDIDIRLEFFRCLRRMGMVPWWTTFRRWQRSVTPSDAVTIFVWLWVFNLDAPKKKLKILLEKITTTSQDTSYQSVTDWTNSERWESWKRRLVTASLRNRGIKLERLKEFPGFEHYCDQPGAMN